MRHGDAHAQEVHRDLFRNGERRLSDCSVRFARHGECPKNRFITAPGGEPGLNCLCAGYMVFFKHIDRPMRLMADLLRHGRCADEARAMLAAAG